MEEKKPPLPHDHARLISSTSSPDWASLHGDILEVILDKLVVVYDYIRFSSVCKSWNSVAMNHKENHKENRMRLSNHELPWLVLRPRGNYKEWHLYNVVTREFFNFPLLLPFEKISSTALWCYGSCYGWLSFMAESDSSLIVLNPLSGVIIHLPQFKSSIIEYLFVETVTLSRDPSLGCFEVLVTFADEDFRSLSIAHLKYGDEFWTYSESMEDDFVAVTFHKDHKLGLSRTYKIVTIDVNSGNCIKINTVSQPWLEDEYRGNGVEVEQYFVESTNGDLLLVGQFYRDRAFMTYKIFKLQMDYSKGQVECIPIQDVGGDCLFLERNCCISVSANNYLQCMPNSIYRVDHSCHDGELIDLCNLNSGYRCVAQIPEGFETDNDTIWLVPSMKY